ncbi:YciI family protein [Acidobacteria bacterium AB60]|nr:YciI family protein [Acidobacteria bacterium AB60]
MQYLLTLYSDEAGWNNMSPEQQKQGIAAYAAYGQALQQAGALVNSNRLRPGNTATTLRTNNGKVQVLDGPFIESKEQLAGYYLIEVPDLDAALSWAGKCPTVGHGIVEVRAIWPSGAPSQQKPAQEAVAAGR